MRSWRLHSLKFTSVSRVSCRRPSSARCRLNTFQRSLSIRALLERQSENPPDQSEVSVTGFIRTIRKHKNVAFAAVGDGSSPDPLQVVLNPAQAESLSAGAAVEVTGSLVESPNRTKQAYELRADNVVLLGANDAETYPIQPKYHTPEFLRTLPHLRSRLPLNSLILRLRSHVIASLVEFFNENDFVQTHPPVITSSDCEGGGEVFTVEAAPGIGRENAEPTVSAELPSTMTDSSDRESSMASRLFFRTPKYLTVSNQLHLESLAQSVGKVWTLSPTFRAEKSDTPRHLSEFYMLEAEMCFNSQQGLSAVMSLVQSMLEHVVTRLQSSSIGRDILALRTSDSAASARDGLLSAKELETRWNLFGPKRDGSEWLRITYQEAIGLLKEAVDGGHAFEFPPQLGLGLQAEHERFLASKVSGGAPVFVTEYPQHIKPFYMSLGNPIQDGSKVLETASCFDLLVPDLCELAGGSVREHQLPVLLESMKRHGMIDEANERVPESLRWYTDLRRYGSVPHGGFGLGFDRLLCFLSGVHSVRDVVTFPRWYGRCDN